MNEFGGLITLGRAMRTTSARMGALIQLEEDVAYLVNEPRSLAMKIQFKESLGTGTFYAGEAISVASRVQRRDPKVLFEWRELGKIRRVLVPNKDPIKDKVEEVLGRNFKKEGMVKVPTDMLDDLSKDILVTRLRAKNNEIHTVQRRSDGTVELNNSYKLSRGLVERKYPDTEEVSIFTMDLYVLKGLVNDLYLNFWGPTVPVSVASRLNFGALLVGVIAFLVYEV